VEKAAACDGNLQRLSLDKGMIESQCNLCRTTAPLCRSHILPEFLYRPLYDEKHRHFVVRAGQNATQLAQRGLTEKLLCSACEQRFSRYEKYAAEVMTGRMGHRYKNQGRRIVITGLDYEKFKLFQMSILWRAAVSSLDFFRLVTLGPHQEALREMLLSDDPGMPDRFGWVKVNPPYASLTQETISA
jgi:hypothetical protein